MNKIILILIVINIAFKQNLYKIFIIQNLTTQQVVDIAEQQLEKLSLRSQQLYQNKCEEQCEKQIYDECSSYVPELQCEQNFTTILQCQTSGVFMTWDHSAGRCAIGMECNGKQDKEIACTQAKLFDIDENNDSIRHDVNSPIVFQYVGFINSFRTIYPYLHYPFDSKQQCRQYDPRYRPWYVGAITGAKNIIIMIDNSNSMDQQNRFKNAKQAAYAVIDTLGQYDWLGIISFSNTANSPFPNLVQATQNNKDLCKKYIDELKTDDLTNYESAFTLVFDLIQNTIDQEQQICGETIIQFLTDGLPTLGLGAIDSFLNNQQQIQQINEKNEIFQNWLKNQIDQINNKITIFSYLLGSSIGQDFPKSIACNNNGIFYKIEDSNSSTDLILQMRQYYDYLVQGNEINETIWSEIYKDTMTGKNFITVSRPIYVQNQQNLKSLLGVAGIDIDIDTIKQNNDFEKTIMNIQGKQRKSCFQKTINLTGCQLQTLRNDQQCKDQILCDQYIDQTDECNNIISQNQWVTQHSNNEYGELMKYDIDEISYCCPLTQLKEEIFNNKSKINFMFKFIFILIFLIL